VRLENIVVDARDPRRLGRFWAAALGADPITDEPGLFEARLPVDDDGAFLDLCFPRVAAPSTSPARLHLDLAGGARQREVVERLRGLGAEPVDIGQGDVPWVVLADPEGHAFCVMEERTAHRDTGPVAALPLDSADPARDAAFWAAITGWVPYAGSPSTLRHPSGRGPLLELCPEPAPKAGKNAVHLDVRPAAGEGDVARRLQDLGATAVTGPGELPWQVFTDPSGNEFCLLAAPDGRRLTAGA
jgi:hypothetical protein